MKKLLLVDDNKKYGDLLKEHFEALGYTIDEASSAGEGLEKFSAQGLEHYRVIVTDITMESELAGLIMLYKIRKLGFKGTVVVASTGFDYPTVITLSRLLLRICGVHYMIRKTTVLEKRPEFCSIKFFSKPGFEFSEIQN